MHVLQEGHCSQPTSLIWCEGQRRAWFSANRQRYWCMQIDRNIWWLCAGYNIPGEGNGGQVADSRLFRAGVLDDLSAQVAALDGAQVLLVGLAVAAVLVQHVWVASLNLQPP